MKLIEVTIEGITPTLTHNGQLSDPMNKWAKAIKEISGKRDKSDDDYVAMARLEWYGSLYLNDQEQPCWPSECIESLLISAAKKSKEGPKAKTGLLIEGMFPILHPGPKAIDDLWADEGYRMRSPVRVGTSRVIRTRPIFRQWSIDLQIYFSPEVVNKANVMQWLAVGGREVGLSDWRPKYGRYEVKG